MAVNLPNFIEDREEANNFLRFYYFALKNLNSFQKAAQNAEQAVVDTVSQVHQNQKESPSLGISLKNLYFFSF